MGARKHSLSEQRAVGARIREARRKAGVKASEVAAAADITQNHYWVIERGEAMPSAPTLRRIARRLGVTVDSLQGDADESAGDE